jgi:DNA-binding HxlR family transcriptional regulator
MKKNECLDINVCPVLATLAVVGGKWKPAILWMIRQGVHRFGALQRSLQGITQKMLTKQLRELEADGVIVRTVFAEVPPRVEYTFSEHGKSLQPLLDAMANWGAAHRELARGAGARKPGVTR